MDRFRLNLPAIESSLRAVQEDFVRINESLSVPRDPLTDEVRENMTAGYRLVDAALARDLDLLEFGQSKTLLALNRLVLCGCEETDCRQCARHLSFTEQRFYETEGGGIGALMEWIRHHKSQSVWRRAAGAYIHILSQPQLYIEGNHRTGALIMSYMLAQEGRAPFVLSVNNAKAYFDPSTLVKETRKGSIDLLRRLPKLKKRLARLLKEDADSAYLLRAN